MTSRGTFVSLAALALAGCAVGPDYQRPATPSATATTLANAGPATASAPLPDGWWRLFNDPVLDRLIGQALAHNTDLRQAEGNLRQARGLLAEARAGRLPTTSLSASATRNRVSTAAGTATAGGIGGGAGGGTGLPGGGGGIDTGGTGTGGAGTGAGTITTPSTFTANYFSIGFDAAYEVDVFGGITRRIQEARADAEAAAAALDAARVSVAAETARNYALACGYAEQADVARETVRLQERTLDLTQRLFAGGRDTRREVSQAATLLENARADVPNFEGERRASLAALAVLTGVVPNDVDAAARSCAIVPRVPSVIPIGDGEALLRRRPDLREAERRLASATADIGVQTAELYPHISLGGSVGLGATKLGRLGDAAAFTYSIGPLISWSFPNVAVARARISQARAGADVALAAFDGTVLTALSETEQALARYQGQLERNQALVRAEAASTDAAQLSRIRFDAGADSFLQLIDAERDRAAARASRAQSDAAVVDAQVSLFKALGGGWENAPLPTRQAQR